MVLREHRGANYMATSPKRSSRLHNFSFPFLKWGNQRHMRCANAAAAAAAIAGASFSGDRCSSGSKSDESSATRKRTRPANASGSERQDTVGGDEDGIAAVREKLMLDLKTAADKMKDAILRNGKEEEKQEEEPATPWNLRTRRAECNAPFGSDVNEKKRDCLSTARPNDAKLPKLRSNSEKNQRAKFSVKLSWKEVEEDFMAMTGRQPSRRPKKRPKVVQKKLDTISPGLWLTEVTADSYKVIEATENQNGKKRKGKDVSLSLSDSESE